jgi:phosphate/sulfate permease
VGSWFVSPVLSGVISVSLYLVIRRFILNASDPIARGLFSLPIFYGITIFINVFTIVHNGSTRKCSTVSPEAAPAHLEQPMNKKLRLSADF